VFNDTFGNMSAQEIDPAVTYLPGHIQKYVLGGREAMGSRPLAFP